MGGESERENPRGRDIAEVKSGEREGERDPQAGSGHSLPLHYCALLFAHSLTVSLLSLLSQGNSIPGVLKFHGVITTFEMIMADCPELKKLHWRCVVIDEAHRLKNRNCKLLEGLKMMDMVRLWDTPPG